MSDIPIDIHLLRNYYPFEKEVVVTGFLDFNKSFYQQHTHLVKNTGHTPHVILLIDTSYSMSELENNVSKIEKVVNTLKSIIEDDLLQNMYISLVKFDEKASVIINHIKVDNNKNFILSKLNELLNLGTTTYSSKGLEKIRKDIEVLNSEATRVIMFTDGEDFDELEALKQTRLLLKQGVTLSSIGVGEDYNDEFLLSMANEGKGSFFHLHNMNELLQEIEYDIKNLKEEIITNSNISLFHPSNVIPIEFYKVSKIGIVELTVENREILCGNIIESDKIFFKLKLTNIKKEGSYVILTGTVGYMVSNSNKRTEFTIRVRITKNLPQGEYPSPEVINLNKLISLYKKAKLISELQNEGKEKEARNLFYEIKPLASAIGIDDEIEHIISKAEHGETITKNITRTLLSFTRTKTITKSTETK